MSHRNLLARATEGTDAPTPGYLYIDLAKIATGNPGACQEMANYLTRRLASKNNPNIKTKCCKVLSKLCDAVPRNAFRRCVAQDHAGIGAIKEAMQFRGTPDPVRGDEPNHRVREAAKECLDAVYREAPSSEQQATTMQSYSGGGGGISSDYGSSPHGGGGGGGYSGGGGAYNGQPSRMQGIGNPRFSDPRNDPRYNGEQPHGAMAVLKETGEVIAGMIKDPLARNIDVPHNQPRQGHSGNLPGYGGPQVCTNVDYYVFTILFALHLNANLMLTDCFIRFIIFQLLKYGRPPPGQSELSRNTGGQWTMASNRGPGAIQPDYQRDSGPQYGGGGGVSANSGTVGGSWGSAPSGPTSSSVIRPSNHYSTPSVTVNSAPGVSGGGAAVSDGTYEKNLVKELCPPSGMKPVPPPDKLANFARACASLNSDLVCPVMLDYLEDGQPWIIRAKALCAMETAIANGTKPDGNNPYRDFFFACQDEIAPLVSHPRAPIHEPARRVLTLLGVDTASAATTAASAAAPVAAAPNLLDFDDPPPPPTEAPPPAPAAAPPAPGGGGTMFGGMQVKSTAAAAPIAAAPVAAAPEPSLLDWDAPAPAAAASSDPFSSGATNAAVAETSSMFGQLNVKASASEDNRTGAAAVGSLTDIGTNDSLTSAPPAGSAFGFINSDPAPPAPGANGQPPSFDPLKGGNGQHFSPTSAKKAMSMQMSPEQMQAMAYQQMMMQQQMQQMQMAMAMQQQGKGGGGMPMFPNIAVPGNAPQRMPSAGSMPQQQFSFGAKPAQKDDKKFDFVMDAMKTAGHKK